MAAGEWRPLGIGVCAPYDLGRDGGVNSHIRAQARALRQLGHTVTVFGASSAPLSDGELALSTSISMVIGGTETGIGVDPRSWWRVARLFQTSRFDILHVHEPLMPLLPWFALRQSTAPVVATFHTYREQGHRWYRRYRRLLAPLMRRIHARLAVSEAARRTVTHDFPGDYEVVPNGIDVGRFRQATTRPPSASGSPRVVLFVGRLEPRKGVDRLIRAMTIVQAQAADARLVIVGDGPDRAALESLARDACIDATFTGRVPEEALPDFYHAADLVCSPALGDESFGIVLLEAMASARPIVATRIDGYAELLSRADCARLVEVDDTTALARELTTLLDAPRLRSVLGERGRMFVRNYDWAAISRHLESIYLSLANTATSGRNEYGSRGLNASEASDRFDRPFTR